MFQRLDRYTGFGASFDADTLTLETFDGMKFQATSRTAGELSEVLLEAEAAGPDREVYRNYRLVELPPNAAEALARFALTYSLVMIPPSRIGKEYAKTAGHYHPAVPSTTLAFPEVYTQLFGRLDLLLQRRHPEDPEQLDDCVHVEMVPGYLVTLPPGYAHVLVNTTEQPALMAGLYGASFKPDYGPVRQRRGMAYYLLSPERGGVPVIMRNPHYPDAAVPPLRRLTELTGTPFAPPERDVPLWQSFLREPKEYEFLAQADALVAHFTGNGHGAVSQG